MSSATLINTAPSTRRRCRCGTELAPSSKSRRCRLCHREYEKRRQLKARSRELRPLVSAVARTDPGEIGRLKALLQTMITRFGGVERLARLWARTIADASQSGRGALVMLRSCLALANIAALIDALEPPPPRDAMELTEWQARMFVQFLIDHPAAVAEAQRTLGWQVTPPESEECDAHDAADSAPVS